MDQSFAKRLDVAGRKKQTAAGVFDEFRKSPVVGDHDRNPGRHRLERKQTFGFSISRRDTEQIDGLQELNLLGAVNRTDVLEVRLRDRPVATAETAVRQIPADYRRAIRQFASGNRESSVLRAGQ